MRLALLPFIVPFVVAIGEYVLVEPHDNPRVNSGTILLGFLLFMAQVVVGIPSLLALDSMKKGLWGYVATGATFTIVFSLTLGLAMRKDPANPTGGFVFSVLLCLGVPLIAGYALAFCLRRYCEDSA